MNSLDIKNLKITHESGKNIFAFCQFHEDTNKPNLRIQKSGDWKGAWICFACGATGRLTEEELDQVCELPVEEKEPRKLDYSLYTRSNELDARLAILADKWNVDWSTVVRLRTGYYKNNIYTFPMFDSDINLINIQYRDLKGNKWSVENHPLGIFIPTFPFRQTGKYYITEGVSDLAVVLELGLNGMARPNCNACKNIIKDYIYKYISDEIIIIADNDEVGIDGAIELRDVLDNDTILIPETKDLRDLYKQKGREKTLEFLNV